MNGVKSKRKGSKEERRIARKLIRHFMWVSNYGEGKASVGQKRERDFACWVF